MLGPLPWWAGKPSTHAQSLLSQSYFLFSNVSFFPTGLLCFSLTSMRSLHIIGPVYLVYVASSFSRLLLAFGFVCRDLLRLTLGTLRSLFGLSVGTLWLPQGTRPSWPHSESISKPATTWLLHMLLIFLDFKFSSTIRHVPNLYVCGLWNWC